MKKKNSQFLRFEVYKTKIKSKPWNESTNNEIEVQKMIM